MTREEAIKVVKEFINGTCLHLVDQEALETLIPELKESEDEKIRKEMIRYFTEMKKGGSAALPYDDCIAYLKKQKEQKSADEAEKFFDSAESYNQGFVAGQKKMKEDIKKGFGISEHSLDYLAGRYAGYAAARQEQKPEWSEEDKAMLNNIILGVHMKSITPLDEMDDRNKYEKYEDFLKSLPERFVLQPKQNDMITPNKEFFQWIYDRLVNVHKEDPNVDYMISFKKRIEESSWKPSEEQMGALSWMLENVRGNIDFDPLKDLYEQLKKL